MKKTSALSLFLFCLFSQSTFAHFHGVWTGDVKRQNIFGEFENRFLALMVYDYKEGLRISRFSNQELNTLRVKKQNDLLYCYSHNMVWVECGKYSADELEIRAKDSNGETIWLNGPINLKLQKTARNRAIVQTAEAPVYSGGTFRFNGELKRSKVQGFTGVWEGSEEVFEPFRILQTKDKLYLAETGNYIGRETFTIQGNDLLLRDQKVGTISEHQIHINWFGHFTITIERTTPTSILFKYNKDSYARRLEMELVSNL